MVVGLLVSGAFLRFACPGLRGSFFGRYGLMVLAICVGGASMGPLLVSIDVLFGNDFATPRTLLEAASVVAYATVVGWILGAFGGRSTAGAQPQP